MNQANRGYQKVFCKAFFEDKSLGSRFQGWLSLSYSSFEVITFLSLSGHLFSFKSVFPDYCNNLLTCTDLFHIRGTDSTGICASNRQRSMTRWDSSIHRKRIRKRNDWTCYGHVLGNVLTFYRFSHQYRLRHVQSFLQKKYENSDVTVTWNNKISPMGLN